MKTIWWVILIGALALAAMSKLFGQVLPDPRHPIVRSARAYSPKHAEFLKSLKRSKPALRLRLGVSAPGSVTLAWTASPSNAVGYNIYYGTRSQAYTNKVNVGNVTSATLAGLARGTNYYFVATAYDSGGLESDYSNEAVGAALAPPPPTNYYSIYAQTSTNLTGPFADVSTNVLMRFTNDAPKQFFRLRVGVSQIP